jgi:hypothetical protein
MYDIDSYKMIVTMNAASKGKNRKNGRSLNLSGDVSDFVSSSYKCGKQKESCSKL